MGGEWRHLNTSFCQCISTWRSKLGQFTAKKVRLIQLTRDSIMFINSEIVKPPPVEGVGLTRYPSLPCFAPM